MSVPKSRRGESNALFVYKARELKIHTMRQCVHFPKRFTFYIGQDIAESANRIYRYVIQADNIYPVNKHEAQERRDWVVRAEGELKTLNANICVADEMFGISENIMLKWSELIDTEMRLLTGVKKKDRERYKNLDD